MAVYILDTCVIRELRYHFRAGIPAFDRMWEEIEEMISNSKIVFVKESFEELSGQLKDDANQEWLKIHKKFFTLPSNEECEIVAQLFLTKNFQDNVPGKHLRDGRPVADPFLVARAKAIGDEAVVVSREKYKPNAAKIPNMCEEFEVAYMDDAAFQALVLR